MREQWKHLREQLKKDIDKYTKDGTLPSEEDVVRHRGSVNNTPYDDTRGNSKKDGPNHTRIMIDLLPEGRVKQLGYLLLEGYSQADIARKWGLSRQRIGQLVEKLRRRLDNG